MYLENVLFKGRYQPIVPPFFLRHAHETPARSLAGFHGRQICDSAFVLQKGDVTVRIAHTSHDLHLAEGLVKERYAWRGYQLPTPHVHHPLRKTFLASSGTRLLGTLSILLDSKTGLVADALFKPELDRYRKLGHRVCELGKLAISQAGNSREVAAALFNMAYLYGRTIHRVSDTFIEVNPRHVSFYRRLLGFDVVAKGRHCPRVNAPAILMHLDVAHADRQISQLATSGGSAQTTGLRSPYSSFLTKQQEESLIKASLEPTEAEAGSQVAFA
jgi:hypothetical protein